MKQGFNVNTRKICQINNVYRIWIECIWKSICAQNDKHGENGALINDEH